MKLGTIAASAVTIFLSHAAAVGQNAEAASVEFTGNFSNVEASNSACETLLQTGANSGAYVTKNFAFGSSIVVTNFSGNTGGFLDGVNFAGNLGYFGDVTYEDDVIFQGTRYRVGMYFMFSSEAMYGDVVVQQLDANADVVCTLSADYLGN